MLIPILCQAEGGQLFGEFKLKRNQGERINEINLIMNDHEYHYL